MEYLAKILMLVGSLWAASSCTPNSVVVERPISPSPVSARSTNPTGPTQEWLDYQETLRVFEPLTISNRKPEALVVMKEFAQRYPDSPRGWWRLFLLAENMGRPEEARLAYRRYFQALDRMSSFSTQESQYRCRYAELSEQVGDFETAKTQYRKVCERTRRDTGRGGTLLQRGLPTGDRQTKAWALLAAGQDCDTSARDDEALRFYERAFETDPNDSHINLVYGTMLETKRRFAEAKARYIRANELFPASDERARYCLERRLRRALGRGTHIVR